MRKFALVLVIISVMLFAGSAFAHGDFGRHHRGFDSMFAPDMPKEMRGNAAEIAKLYVDLEEALTSQPLNKAKAREVYGTIIKLEQELDIWEFEKYLDEVDEFNKQPQPIEPPEPESNEIQPE